MASLSRQRSWLRLWDLTSQRLKQLSKIFLSRKVSQTWPKLSQRQRPPSSKVHVEVPSLL